MKSMPTGKNDDVIENQTTENRDINRTYIAGIDVMPKPKNQDNLQEICSVPGKQLILGTS